MGFRRPGEEPTEEPADTVLWGGAAKRRTTVKMTREEVFGVGSGPPPPAGASKTVPQGSPEATGQADHSGPGRPPLASNPALTGGSSQPGPNRHRSYPEVDSYPPAPGQGTYAAATPPAVPHYTPPQDRPAHEAPEARGTVPIGPDAPAPGEEPRMDLGSTLIMDELDHEPPPPQQPIDPDSSAALQAIAYNAGRLNLPAARRYDAGGDKVEPAPPVKMNKWSYRLVIFGCLIVAALIFAATYDAAKTDASLAVGFTWIPFVPAAMMHFVLIHRMWQSVQDNQARMTPGRAVGFMFIPLFNLYWVFEVFPGFATDYNAYVDRHGLRAPKLSRGLLVAMVLIPGLNLILYWIAIGKICDGVSQLSEQ